MVLPASKEKGRMVISRNLKEKLLPILVSRVVIFFFIMCLLTLFLYAAGTNQGFVDSTQLALLRLYLVLGIFLAVFSVCGCIVGIVRFLRIRKARYFFRACGYLLLAIFGAVTVIIAALIMTLSAGNGA